MMLRELKIILSLDEHQATLFTYFFVIQKTKGDFFWKKATTPIVQKIPARKQYVVVKAALVKIQN